MKKIIGVLFCLAVQNGFADLGSSSGGGGGIAEKNIIFAFQNLNKYINICLRSTSCRLNEKETKTLRKILHNLQKEGSPSTLFEFASEKATPNFFMIDGAVRIAKTGFNFGDKIYFNKDLLYTKKPNSEENIWTPISLFSSVSLLVHEFGHHTGEKDHLFLDSLGSKVEVQLLKDSQTIDGTLFHKFVKMTLVYSTLDFPITMRNSKNTLQSNDYFTQILIEDRAGIRDITSLLLDLKSSSLCLHPITGQEEGDKDSHLMGAFFYNPHFTGENKCSGKNCNEEQISIQGKLNFACESNGSTNVFNEFYDLRLNLNIQTNFPYDTDYSYLKGTTELFECSQNSNCH